MKNILVPTDFSEYANNAYELACEIANQSQGEVTLLHVLEYPVMSMFNTTGEVSMDSIKDVYIINLKKRAEAELDKKLNHPSYPRVKINKQLRIGNPYENISAQIEKSKADLVVMGTKGASGLREIFIGSNAEKVVRFAKCPVITVPGKFNLSSIHKIAYGISFNEDHTQPLMELKKYLHLFNAELQMVWIDSPFEKLSESQARIRMEDMARIQMLSNYSVNCHKGTVADDGLLYYAEENNIDMIALATHGRKGLAHLFVGSFAEDIVNHSTRPVWTFALPKKSKIRKKHEAQEEYH